MNHWPLKISRTEGSADFRTHSCMTQRSQFWIILCPIHEYVQWNTLCTLTQHLLLIHAHGTYKSIIINWRATAFYIDWVIQKFSLWMLIRFLWKMFMADLNLINCLVFIYTLKQTIIVYHYELKFLNLPKYIFLKISITACQNFTSYVANYSCGSQNFWIYHAKIRFSLPNRNCL